MNNKKKFELCSLPYDLFWHGFVISNMRLSILVFTTLITLITFKVIIEVIVEQELKRVDESRQCHRLQITVRGTRESLSEFGTS